MRPSWKILVAAAAMSLMVPPLAFADEIDDQIREMSERMEELQQRLEKANEGLATSGERLEEQQELLEDAGLRRRATSGLSAFLSETEFSGFLATSWNYNWSHPDASSVGTNAPFTQFGENTGNLLLTAPHHQNSNSFQVDQFFLSMVNRATPESRAGWGVELVFGAAADNQSLAVGAFGGGAPDTGDLSHLYQAYVEYLLDLGGYDVGIKAGRFETTIGAESFRADSNYNITRGLVWSMQPVNHTGIMMYHHMDNGVYAKAGLVNSYDNTMSDYDNEKTFIWGLGYEAETASIALNGLWGGDPADVPGPLGTLTFGLRNNDKDEVMLLDLVGTWTPNEQFSAWVNLNAYWTDGAIPDFAVSSLNIFAAAIAGRYAINERLGFSMRGEYVHFDDANIFVVDFIPVPFHFPGLPFGLDTDLWALTGTVDYALTDNLTLKVEGRYDAAWLQGVEDNVFIDNESFFRKEDQVLTLVQLMYHF